MAGKGSLTAAFLDLASYDDIDRLLYGGCDSYSYFVREVRKCTWYTMIPAALSRAAGSGGFGQDWSAIVSRAGDFILNTWVRITLPAVTLKATVDNADYRLRWCRQVGHNIIREASITFNDLQAERFDNYFLDFWSAFTVSAGKRTCYQNLIGNIADLIQPHAPGETIPSMTLNVPLPFFFTRDSGNALPMARCVPCY